MTTLQEFGKMLEIPEGARIEFKAASGGFHFEELIRYAVALANEGGGTIVLGVSNERPRRVVGTDAFREPGRTEAGVFEQLGHRVRIEEQFPEGKRVLIIRVPSRGFLTVLDNLWEAVSLRNGVQHFQQGLFVWDVPTFDERAVREAVLNAVSHRDYRHGGSVLVRQYPKRIEIVSPGGFPAGINEQNLLWEQNPRNRRIAEALGKCGLVERAGQGFDLIYQACIRQSKPLPDFARTSEHSVWVTLHGDIQDPEFLRFFEEIGRERLASFATEDFLVVDLVHRDQPIPSHLSSRLPFLLDQGVIERVGRGRGTHYLLSRRFYRFLGRGGMYTRRRGLDRETNKELLVRHIEDSDTTGATLAELQEVLPGLSRNQVQSLLRELKREGRVAVEGKTKAARWFAKVAERNSAQS